MRAPFVWADTPTADPTLVAMCNRLEGFASIRSTNAGYVGRVYRGATVVWTGHSPSLGGLKAMAEVQMESLAMRPIPRPEGW